MQSVLLLVICWCMIMGLQACGISTHMEIGHMAASIYNDHHPTRSYKQLIMKHQDAFQAGNTYPDTYYSSACLSGKYHQVSEDTHWTAFTNITLQYIRDNFPPPWSEETEKLVVFMLGFVSHQVADITWHSLGIRQGFIRTMAAIDFHGVYDTAHSTADLGGDVINEFRGDYSYFRTDQWYIPVNHLSKIYQRYYNDSRVTTDVIEECTALILVAVLGEKIGLSEIYSYNVAPMSPFLTQNLDSFFLGGMYDMALWTTTIWDDVIYILENGFSKNCTTPDNPLYIRCDGVHKASSIAWSRTPAREPLRGRLKVKSSSIMRQRTDYGVVLKPTASFMEKLNARKRKQAAKHAVRAGRLRKATEPLTAVISTKDSYARFGHVTLSADVNNDNISDLIISAPMSPTHNDTDYEGKVYILLGSPNGFSKGDFLVENLANFTLVGSYNSGGRFGSAVAVLDVNLDGYADIVVSSPNIGWKNLTYNGSLSVWFGNRNGTFANEPSLIHMDSKAPLYNNEGIVLLAEDIDGDGSKDLIVGSPLSPGHSGPQSGKVCAIKSSKTFNFSSWKCVYGPGLAANTSWFGTTMLVANIPKRGRVLVVGSPIFRKCALASCEFNTKDVQSAGQITMWSLPELTLLAQINGSTEHEHFGSSLSLGFPYGHSETGVLAVGMDSVDVNGSTFGISMNIKQAGGVALYNLTTLLSSDVRPFAVLYGDRQFSMFGSATEFEDLDGDGKDELMVGSPHFTDDPTDLIYGAEQGIVRVFGGKATGFPLDDVSADVCSGSYVLPCPTKVASSVLSWDENKAHLGGRLAVLGAPNQAARRQVAVTALRSSHGARHSGAVLIF